MFKKLLAKRNVVEYGWFGDYPSWEAVSEKTGGYNENVILEKTKQAMLKVKSGEAVYERDSVIFDKKEYPFPLIAFLLHSAILKKRPLHVLDFGGSLGSTYYQIKEFLTPQVCASWNVVEQEHYVTCGQSFFEDNTLKFYETIDACMADKKVDFVLLSSSVQYLEKPHVFLEQLAAYNFEFILFDRTAFHDGAKDRLTLQRVPPEIYPASYPAWFFNREGFLDHFRGRYEVMSDFGSYISGEEIMNIDGQPAGYDRGFYLVNLLPYA